MRDLEMLKECTFSPNISKSTKKFSKVETSTNGGLKKLGILSPNQNQVSKKA